MGDVVPIANPRRVLTQPIARKGANSRCCRFTLIRPAVRSRIDANASGISTSVRRNSTAPVPEDPPSAHFGDTGILTAIIPLIGTPSEAATAMSAIRATDPTGDEIIYLASSSTDTC